MRLKQIDLIKFGKFTGQTLSLPRQTRDFHLIVGPNEAGKSTLRRAISELLYGMPLRSEMDFLHPLAELRLGAVIESDTADALAFHRRRGKQSLRRPDDSVLPEGALSEYLGNTSANLFQRMFCLDLEGLLAGGRTILDASDDVGQLLFQSAAGIASLGAVRDALTDEASRLYAPRKSGDRAFYQALERLETAKGALRAATVNTRSWTAASGKVSTIAAEMAEAGHQYQARAEERRRLDRLRRIGPHVARWRDAQAELAQLAEATLFPTDAAQRLAQAEVTLATQSATLQLHRTTAQALQVQIDALKLDPTILARAQQVQALAEQGQTVSNHPRDIARRGEEVQALLRDAGTLATQLGWPTDEAALRAHVPGTLVLKTLAGLMQSRGALVQAHRSADDNHRRAQTTVERLQGRQAQPAVEAASGALSAALSEAQAYKQTTTRQRAHQAALQQAQIQLDRAQAMLAPWTMPVPALAGLVLPSEERVAALKAERATLAARLETTREQHIQADDQARVSALALRQFAAGRSLVTLEEVLQARQLRDHVWGRIKTQAESLDAAAPQLDAAIGQADQLVDSQRDSATDSAKLLSLRQDCERDVSAAEARAAARTQAEQALGEFDARWARDANQAGMPGMPLADASTWMLHRKAALDAAAATQAKELELQTESQAAEAVTTTLRAALRAAGIQGATTANLGELCALAEQRNLDQQAAKSAAELLVQQIAEAQAEVAHQAQALQRQTEELAQWQSQWQNALKQARLDTAVTQVESASPAIEIAERIRSLLGDADEKRVNRIQAMQRDLDGFDQDAKALLEALSLPSAACDPVEAARTLLHRLQVAREVQKDHDRLQTELKASGVAVLSADAAQATTKATLQSLYALAHSEDHAIVRGLISLSDHRYACEAESRLHRQAIVDAGDALSFDALLADCNAVPSETVKSRLEELDQELGELVEQRTHLAGELAQARAELQRVHGGADAAVAESMRLEALAQMGDAAERYVKVAAAARLLRWAIDRYRERKQGPLLQRAGDLFARLTLDGFSRLVPDFEVNPPKLIAVRHNGDRVAIDGLSEGTRDQLFLALRLAALEMHIANDTPLPFIADDLFVNFHDSRSRAGLSALGELSKSTQVIFLTHHEHLVDVARESIGRDINVIELAGSA